MSGDITYVHGGVAELSSQVGTTAAQLMEIHDQVLNETTSCSLLRGRGRNRVQRPADADPQGSQRPDPDRADPRLQDPGVSELAHALDVNIGAGSVLGPTGRAPAGVRPVGVFQSHLAHTAGVIS